MRPVVGIPCCTRQIGLHPFHIVGDKYIRAVTDGAGALPLLVPALGDGYDPDDLLDRLDGLLLTGSPSNVEPHHYAGPASREGTHHDPDRDSTTLPLIRRALDRGIPSLFICRGIQELNVARAARCTRTSMSSTTGSTIAPMKTTASRCSTGPHIGCC